MRLLIIVIVIGYVAQRLLNSTGNLMIFQPQPPIDSNANHLNCPYGYILKHKNNTTVTLFANGNASDAEYGMEFLKTKVSFNENSDLLAIEYPGYGRFYRKESPSIQKSVDRVKETIRWCCLNYKKVNVIAQSIGTMVVSLALKDISPEINIEKIILITPFSSLPSVAGCFIPYIGSSLINIAYPTMPSVTQCLATFSSFSSNLGKIELHIAKNDEITPYHLGMQLANDLQHCRLYVETYDSGHNDIVDHISLKL